MVAASRVEERPPPLCLEQFASSLSHNMEQLLTHPELGSEFRRLEMLLMLWRVNGMKHS